MSTPTYTIRRANDRGSADHGWLKARFTFSFSQYFDPDHMGFRTLRVMNNDTIAPGGGFPMHQHSDMEIFTYIVDGELAHQDSMGNGSTIKAGDLQYMSAGSGVSHSEFNPSSGNPVTLYQVWIHPRERGGEPRYSEKPLGTAAKDNALTLLFSGDGREGSTEIRQDAEIYFGKADAGASIEIPASNSTPNVWLQLIEGELSIFGESLTIGDGIAIENAPDALSLKAGASSKFLVFRLN
ncbi:pirin family protein [Haloferula chungangensis]|uniref:Pirin family protein n=1 Tax=Haloferula chungangensis TaxID=1048331 RepID=A0ABW2L747_9BACT